METNELVPQESTAASGIVADQATKPHYSVGYGRPPAGRRFQKGQSGNPRGRKAAKAAADVRIVVEEFFAEPVKVRQRGKTRTISKIEAHIELQLAAALHGDEKAAMSLFRTAAKTGQFNKSEIRRGPVIEPAGTPEERRLLRVFHAHNECHREGPNADEALRVPKRTKTEEK